MEEWGLECQTWDLFRLMSLKSDGWESDQQDWTALRVYHLWSSPRSSPLTNRSLLQRWERNCRMVVDLPDDAVQNDCHIEKSVGAIFVDRVSHSVQI